MANNNFFITIIVKTLWSAFVHISNKDGLKGSMVGVVAMVCGCNEGSGPKDWRVYSRRNMIVN